MIILAIRTDQPRAELYLYSASKLLTSIKWQAHLKLSETIHQKIEQLLNKSSITLNDLEGIAIFKGPGSFTGLRIGHSVANALAYSLKVPIIAEAGDDWLNQAIQKLQAGQNDKISKPEYGKPANITLPKK